MKPTTWLLLVAFYSADDEFEAGCSDPVLQVEAFGSRAEFQKWQAVLKVRGLDARHISADVLSYMATGNNPVPDWEVLKPWFLYRLENNNGDPRFFARERDGSLPLVVPSQVAKPDVVDARRVDERVQRRLRHLLSQSEPEADTELFDDLIRFVIVVVFAAIVVGLIYPFCTSSHRRPPRQRPKTWVQKKHISDDTPND